MKKTNDSGRITKRHVDQEIEKSDLKGNILKISGQYFNAEVRHTK